MCAKEGGKEKTGKTLRRFASLLFSFPWSHALRHQSLAFRDYLTFVWKTKHCPEEEAQDPCMKEQFLWKSLRKQDIQSIYNRCHIIEHFICKPDKRFKGGGRRGGGGGGGQGWHGGESTRLPPMWPRFQSWRRRHRWVEFVVGSLLDFETYFSGYPGFA